MHTNGAFQLGLLTTLYILYGMQPTVGLLISVSTVHVRSYLL